MYVYQCQHCGRQFSIATPAPEVRCPYCSTVNNVAMPSQGYQQPMASPAYQQPVGSNRGVFDNGPSGYSRGVAGLLAILVGALGIHYFYIGKSTAGIIFLLVSLLTCGIGAAVTGIIAFIQGIIFLTTTEEEFERKFVNTPSSIPLF